MEKRRVLITGLGAITPLGHNADDTWQAVKDGVCGIGPITHYDCSAQKVHLAAEVKDWDPTTVLDKKDVRHMSRYIQLAMTAAKECLADSGLDLEAEEAFEQRKARARQLGEEAGTKLLLPMGLLLILVFAVLLVPAMLSMRV